MEKVTIGKLANACSVKIDTVRYYERLGLLKPKSHTDAGYRLYDNESIAVLTFIKHAQHIGFSLEEIRGFIDLRISQNDKCSEVKRRIQEKIRVVEKKERKLNEIKSALREVENDCNKEKRADHDCPFLDKYMGRQKNDGRER